MKVIILAGGGGTRLWPISRKKQPKQCQRLFGKETLLEKTFKRLRRGFRQADIFISCGAKHFLPFHKSLPGFPKKNYILEPVARNTAAAIGLAAVKLHKKNPEEIICLANADHFIDNEAIYLKTIKTAEKAIRKNPDHTILIGTWPAYPDTGLGYIEMGAKKIRITGLDLYKAKRFIEKPSLKKAKTFLKKKKYLWNPAYFCWRVDHLLSLYKKYLPGHYKILKRIEKAIGTKKERSILNQEFKKLKPISVDYGIMEKIKKDMLVIPARFSFTDVGHWCNFMEIMKKSKAGNVILGEHLGFETKGSLIYNLTDKIIATAGVEDMVIINTRDALLVCPKENAQQVREIVALLEKKNKNKYL